MCAGWSIGRWDACSVHVGHSESVSVQGALVEDRLCSTCELVTSIDCCLSSVYVYVHRLAADLSVRSCCLLPAACGKPEQIRIPLQWLSLLCCALQLLADAEFHDKKVCPEATASVLSLVTFAWVGRLMRAGYK